ncbi:MAG: DUF541 domain-containing protein [Acidimicrobiia bacterium]|nr:DUF541 domain-containing protein [Acidimicrobiia bacterium]
MRIFAIVLLSLALSSAVSAQTVEPPQIIATGEGVVKAVADRAWVNIGAESRSRTSKEAQQRNAEAMAAVQAKLAGLGIQKDAIQTTAIDLQLEFDYRDGKQTPRGYVARNTVEVRIDDVVRVGDVLDAVVASGATTLHGLRFDVKDRSGLERSALQSAVKHATAKAQAMAAGTGSTMDRVIRIEEQFTGGGGPEPMMRAAFATAKADAATPVAAGEIEIRAQVRLTITIK